MKNQKIRMMHKSLLALGLLLLTFSSYAQREIDSTTWDSSMSRFAEMDKVSRPPEGAILLTGSSSIARWNSQAKEALAPLSVIPRGFGGSVMQDVLHHLDAVALQYKPRAILIYEGDNDTSFKIPNDIIVGNFEKIVARVHAQLPDTRIYVLSVKPSLARVDVWAEAQAVSGMMEAIAQRDPLVYYIDVATPFLKSDGKVMDDIFVADGLHLNDKGNVIWGAAIKAGLMKVEGQYE